MSRDGAQRFIIRRLETWSHREEAMWIERVVLGAIVLAVSSACHAAASPHIGEGSRQIKALSSTEIEGYLRGKGMGLARAAELNGYPGPMHVLEMADDMQLSAEQRERSRALFDRMRAAAQRLGEQLVAKERELDLVFSDGDVTARQVDTLTAEIARLYGALRAVHLQAHLDQRAILTEHQNRRYVQLRGYSQSDHASH